MTCCWNGQHENIVVTSCCIWMLQHECTLSELLSIIKKEMSTSILFNWSSCPLKTCRRRLLLTSLFVLLSRVVRIHFVKKGSRCTREFIVFAHHNGNHCMVAIFFIMLVCRQTTLLDFYLLQQTTCPNLILHANCLHGNHVNGAL